MRGPVMPLPPSFLELLPRWVAQQRWYAGKGRVPALTRIGGLSLDEPAGEVGIEIHLVLDESGPARTVYQIPLTCRRARLAGADHALVATVREESVDGHVDGHGHQDARYIYDAPHDPVFAAALLRLIQDEGTASSQGPQGAGVAGYRVTSQDQGTVLASHVMSGEQSNTSLVLDLVDPLGVPSRPLIC